jgi:hypothetical protein
LEPLEPLVPLVTKLKPQGLALNAAPEQVHIEVPVEKPELPQ